MRKHIRVLAANRQALIKQVIGALILCLTAACGGSDNSNHGSNNNSDPTPDYNSNFTGTWQGHATTTMNGQTTTVLSRQLVTALSKNRFRWEDPMCPTNWTADSSTHSTVDAVDGCSVSQSGCNFRLGVSSGTFVREGNGARGSLSGSVTVGSGCIPSPGSVFAYSLNTDLLTRIQGGQINAQSDSLDSSFAPSNAEVFSALSAELGLFIRDLQR